MPLRRALGLAVLASWTAAMGWRVQRDCLPLWREQSRTTYRSALYGRLPWQETFRLSSSGKRVGVLDSQARWESDGTISLTHRLDLDQGLPGLGAWRVGSVHVRLALTLSKDYLLHSFTLDGALGSTPLRGSGTLGPKGMDCRLSLNRPGQGNDYRMLLPLDPAVPLLSVASPVGMKDVPVGGEWDLEIFNPLAQRVERMRALLAARETVTVDGRPRQALRIEVRSPTTPLMGLVTVWVEPGPEGRLLKQRMLGLEMERVEALGDD